MGLTNCAYKNGHVGDVVDFHWHEQLAKCRYTVRLMGCASGPGGHTAGVRVKVAPVNVRLREGLIAWLHRTQAS